MGTKRQAEAWAAELKRSEHLPRQSVREHAVSVGLHGDSCGCMNPRSEELLECIPSRTHQTLPLLCEIRRPSTLKGR